MYLISTELFLVANVDGLYEMEDRCLEALGDKTPFGVEAYYGAEGGYVLNIKCLIEWVVDLSQFMIYDFMFFIEKFFFEKLQN